jgi:lincosamide nucleotidyltransferase A/C/D/E
MNPIWRSILWRQLGAAIDMLENAIKRCPEDLWAAHLWRDEQRPELAELWYVAYHTLFWLDLYLSGAVEGFAPPAPFTLDELDPAGLLPPRRYTQAELLAYLTHCRRKGRAILFGLTDEQALRRCTFPWGELYYGELLLDTMRHVQEHGAQLAMFLGQRTGAAARWVAQSKNGHPEMTAQEVVAFVQLLELHHIEVVLDGGWAVDALLGQQTRLHEDLDIAVQHKDVPQIRALLEARGYVDVPRDDTRECNFVLGDEWGHQIDFHSFTFDEQGRLVFGVEYPLAALQGHGMVAGYPVRCITPEWLVKFHTGYRLDANDYHDVKHLCARFGLPLPEAYEAFERGKQ